MGPSSLPAGGHARVHVLLRQHVGRGQLGNGLRAPNFLLAVLAGNLLLGAYTGLLAHIAAKTGLSTHLLARRAFGQQGRPCPRCCWA
jgi:purine-cytosine permease-like protein